MIIGKKELNVAKKGFESVIKVLKEQCPGGELDHFSQIHLEDAIIDATEYWLNNGGKIKEK